MQPSQRTFTGQRWLIGGMIALVFLIVLGFGIAQIIGNQQLSQAKAALQGTPTPGITQIDLTNYAFSHPNIVVVRGTTVTWINRDSATHNVTFDQGGIASGSLHQSQSFSYTFSTPGVYTYQCTFHPEMLGKITVTP